MDFEQELKRVASTYTGQGYQVTIRPGPDELPAFAKDFKVEIVAKRGADGVLVAVKANREEFTADTNVSRYAELTNKQPGWRFDFAILEGENPMGRQSRDTTEFSDEDINRTIAEVAAGLQNGFVRMSFVAAWAALEAAMRMRLRAAGEKAGWGSQPRVMLNELYSSGVLSGDEFRRLEQMSHLRNVVVHGFSSSLPDAQNVQFLSEIAQRLLKESKSANPTVKAS